MQARTRRWPILLSIWALVSKFRKNKKNAIILCAYAYEIYRTYVQVHVWMYGCVRAGILYTLVQGYVSAPPVYSSDTVWHNMLKLKQVQA